jgi:hypothetical protein
VKPIGMICVVSLSGNSLEAFVGPLSYHAEPSLIWAGHGRWQAIPQAQLTEVMGSRSAIRGAQSSSVI